MKLIFTADLHLDTRFSAENNADVRRFELISIFSDILDYAKQNNITTVLLGGDMFDSPYPSNETMASVTALIQKHSDINFYAVCGNHDPLYKTAFYKSVPQNFFVFPSAVTKVQLDDIDLYGVSVKTQTDNSDAWHGFNAQGRFITLSHGALDSDGVMALSSATLSDTGGALHLLGHIHKTNASVLQSGAHALYAGSPAGRGFDECGIHGFYVIDTDSLNYTFVNTNAKIYKEYNVDVTGTNSLSDIITKLSSVTVAPGEIARAVLVGTLKIPFEIDVDALCSFTPQFLEIKDKSELDIDIMKSISENTLEGEFVRILSSMLDSAQNENDKQTVLDAIKEGVLALGGDR